LSPNLLHVAASVGTRLGLGAYPLLFMLVFGWAFGKDAFDAAAAAGNWANYLNVLLLSGFVLVPPAVARLSHDPDRADDRALIRDHVALERVLLALGIPAALVLLLTVTQAFPAIAAQAGARLQLWFVLLAVLALAQLPMTLWLGVAQASGRYVAALSIVVGSRAVALAIGAAAPSAGVGPTAALAAAVAVVVAAQWLLVRSARSALETIAPGALQEPGRAHSVLRANVSSGVVVVVASLVTIVPVSIVGRVLPDEVGHAYAIVTLANALVAVIVAAFFPFSLALAAQARQPASLRRYCARVALGALAITAGLIAIAWLAYPMCGAISASCHTELFLVGTLVVLGAGIRVGSLGPYHAGLYMGHPHYALLSVTVEGVTVVALTWWLLGGLGLYALGAAFVVGGVLRVGVAFLAELRLLAKHGR
jgi:hypothetical protein